VLHDEISDPRTARQRTVAIIRIIVVTHPPGLYVPPSGPPRPPPRPNARVELRDLVASNAPRLPLEVRAALRTAPHTVSIEGHSFITREQEAILGGQGLHAEQRLMKASRQGVLDEQRYPLAGAVSRKSVAISVRRRSVRRVASSPAGVTGGQTRKRRFVFPPR
jgi:hypothetical protein